MDMTSAVHVGDESSILDAVEVDVPEADGMGRRRIVALIAFSALSAGGLFTLMKTLAESNPGSGTEATEQLVRRAEEPSEITVAIVIFLIAAVAVAAAVVALRRHADE